MLWLFVKLDEYDNGFIEEAELIGSEDQDPGHFAEQGKLFSELALPTYALLSQHVLLSKQDLQNPFQKF